MNTDHTLNMTQGRLLPQLIRFTVPLMLSSLLQIAFNAADLIVVGRFGRPTALAAVGSNNSMVNLVVTTLTGLAMGGGVLIARFFGAGEEKRLRVTVSTALYVGFVGGILFGIAGFFLAEPLLRLIGSPEDVAPLAAVYMKIYFCGLPVIALYNAAGAGLRALGNTKQPFLYLAIAGVLNVLLNLFFVLVLGIDVAGVALATVISQCLSCFLTVRCLLRTEGLHLRELRFDWASFGRIARIGLPAGIQGMLFCVPNFLIQASVNSFGTAVIAGNAACISLESFIYVPQNAVSQAATTCMSQNVGAQKYIRTCRTAWLCQGMSAAVTVVICTAAWLLRYPVFRLYTNSDAEVEAAIIRMGIVAVTMLLNGTMDVGTGILRGLGKSSLPAVVTFLGVCVFRVIWTYTVFARFHTLQVLYLAFPISWVFTTAEDLICFFAVRKKPFPNLILREEEL